jgi:diguanylate cyclase (GGDEF)-like protein
MYAVLIVEDERIVAMDLQQTLASMGYDAFAVASSAETALARASEKRPDVVLMDIRIKGKRDGIEVASLLRELYDVPVIYLTAHADEATIERAKKSEPHGYLVKPVKTAELRSAIEISIYRHEMEKRLRERERWFSTTLRSIADAVIAIDVAGNVNFMNPAAEALIGVRAEDMSGRRLWDAIDASRGLFLSDGVTLASPGDLPSVRALANETAQPGEFFVRRPGTEGRWHSIDASPVRDPDGTIRGVVIVCRDVTELKLAAVRDELTGLLNRRGFQDHAAVAIRLANRTSRPCALIYIDVNGMKAINDQLGHAAGDRALVETATLLRLTFRASDLISRLGGDEFVVLAPEYTEDDDGGIVRTRFRHHLAALHADGGRPFLLSASLGITIYDPRLQLRTIEELLAEADARMYVAKQRRRVEGTQPLEKFR